jgi:hypothetical protein
VDYVIHAPVCDELWAEHWLQNLVV